MIQGAGMTLRTLCNIFNAPSQLFNDTSSSTYNNMLEVKKSFYVDAVLPLNEKLIAQLNKDIIPAYNSLENKELRIVQDTSGIEALQQDKKLEAEKNAQNISTMAQILNMPIDEASKTELINQLLGIELNINYENNQI